MKTTWIILAIFSIFFVFTSCTEATDPGGSPEDDVQKFLGTWNVSDVSARLNYSVTIKRNPLSDEQIILENYADLSEQAIGLVINNSIIIDQQEIGSGYQSEGTGDYINSKELRFEFFLDDGIDKELRKATYSK